MADRMGLLPPNSTEMETAVANVIERSSLDDIAGALQGFKFSNPPDAVKPWLAAEWGLAAFSRFFPDAQALIDAGLPWLRVRGTDLAVQIALRWIGLDSAREWQWAVLQIDPGRIVSLAELPDVLQLVNASLPAHVELYRLYHGYDVRRMKLSGGSKLSGSMLSNDSGVWIDGIKVSFGQTHFSSAELTPETNAYGVSTTFISARYSSGPRLDESPYGTRPLPNYPLLQFGTTYVDAPPPALANRVQQPAVGALGQTLSACSNAWLFEVAALQISQYMSTVDGSHQQSTLTSLGTTWLSCDSGWDAFAASPGWFGPWDGRSWLGNVLFMHQSLD